MTARQKDLVRTIRGDVDSHELGIVLPHEHILVDFRRFYVEPADEEGRVVARSAITLDTLSWVRYHQRQCLDALHLDSVEGQINELNRFVRAGGGTIVELTPACAGRNVAGLVEISEATGLHIVAGSGVYLDEYQSDETRAMAIDALAERMCREILEGVDDSGARAGIIGEMGCSWPTTPAEEKAMRAAARAQRATGAAISFHPGRHLNAPGMLLRLLESEGAALDRVVVSHLDRTVPDHRSLCALARTGCYMEFDLFGQESSYIRYGPVDLPNDATRIDRIARLIDAGFGDQILLSLDIAGKQHLVAYGGHGYAHILERVVPRMQETGIEEKVLHRMLVENPARMLALGS
jgi:phosphotriesterase-related protein